MSNVRCKVMEAPPGKERGWKRVHCTEVQAEILRKVGWREVGENKIMPEVSWGDEAEVVSYNVEEMDASPPDVTLEPEPVIDPETITTKPKRKYTRRVVISVDDQGNAHYKKKPRRQYRRRDMTAED